MGLPALALQAAGGAIGAFGKYQAGEAAGNAADYQAQVADNNALIAHQNRETSFQVGELDLGRQGMRNRAQSGAIRSGMAASGVDVNSGSSANVQAAAAELEMLDSLTIRSDAARKAYGFQIEEQSQRAQAGLLRSQANEARRAGKLAAIGSLIGTAGSVAGEAWKGQQRGLTA